MLRGQNRIVAALGPVVGDARHTPARRAWAEEAVRWASADQDLVRANEQLLLAALRTDGTHRP